MILIQHEIIAISVCGGGFQGMMQCSLVLTTRKSTCVGTTPVNAVNRLNLLGLRATAPAVRAIWRRAANMINKILPEKKRSVKAAKCWYR